MLAAASGSSSATPRTPDAVVGWFQSGSRPLVALSGGVDSGVTAALAFDAWGDAAVAVSLTGPAVAARETSRARAVARSIGIALVEVAVDPLGTGEYRANPVDRCYFCRSTETTALRGWGEPRGFTRFVDGVHLDDLGDVRPGLRALAEAGFEHPLVWAGWRKADIRAYAHGRRLPNWDQPSDACLASRVRHGQPISAELLGRVDAAEGVLLNLGFRRVRVRVEGNGARVEVDPREVPRLMAGPTAAIVTDRLVALGFHDVRLDPRGYLPRPGA